MTHKTAEAWIIGLAFSLTASGSAYGGEVDSLIDCADATVFDKETAIVGLSYSKGPEFDDSYEYNTLVQPDCVLSKAAETTLSVDADYFVLIATESTAVNIIMLDTKQMLKPRKSNRYKIMSCKRYN